MGWFGKSFEEKVEDALKSIQGMNLAVRNLSAQVEDEVVTLKGNVADLKLKGVVAQKFNELVETKQTINQIKVDAPPAAPPEPAIAKMGPPIPEMSQAEAIPVATTGRAAAEAEKVSTERWHDVVSGDTLSALAKKYYGNATKYPKIFEANRDILDNPDRIKVGQRLRIPE